MLDSHENKTHVNGKRQRLQAEHSDGECGEETGRVALAAIWTRRCSAPTALKTPANVTAFHNGALIQNHFELKGETVYVGTPSYKK